MPPAQEFVRQSWFTLQALPIPHCGQPPPQLISVSEPFWTGSEHVAFSHSKSTQAWLAQSEAVVHLRKSRHGPHTPPQSTSLSFWFWRPSEHEAGRQAPFEQTPLSQSASAPQSLPSTQGGQSAPPQSLSASPSSALPLMQTA